MTFKPGEGGRKKGSKNKLTLAKMQMREEALRRLNEELPEDAFKGDAIEFFQRIYKDNSFDPQLRLDAAAKLAAIERKEANPDSAPKYVVVMPMPVKDLDEWRALYMEAKPDASPEDVEYHERLAQQLIDKDTGRKLLSAPPWVSPEEDRQ
jgi:hypothetical protein